MNTPLLPSGPHFMEYPGRNVSRCVRCGTFITLDVNTGTLPQTCKPTPQWLRGRQKALCELLGIPRCDPTAHVPDFLWYDNYTVLLIGTALGTERYCIDGEKFTRIS